MKRNAMLNGIWGLIPRVKRMIKEPRKVDRTLRWSGATGVIDGLALATLIPAITALASEEKSWGLRAGSWMWVLAALAVLAAVATYQRSRAGYDMALDFIENVHRKIGNKVAAVPLGWFHGPVAGRLSRMVSTELMTSGQLIAHTVSTLFSGLVSSVVLLIVSWVWDWRLGLVLSISIPLLILILNLASAVMNKGKQRAEPFDVELSSRIVEYTHCQAALRASGRSDDFKPLRQAQSERSVAHRALLWYELAGNILGGAFTQVVIIILISLSAQLAITGTLDPYVSVAFIGISLRFTQMLTDVLSAVLGIENNRVLFDSIDEVLTAPGLPAPHAESPQPTPGTVELQHVSFGYAPEKPVLKDISFSVPTRTMCALVGPSGCGKTTVARLISRFYDVDSGEVLVNGAPVQELYTETLMSQLSMVFQDVYLFDDTLEANIRIGREDASDKEIRHAADMAGVTEIVERLPDGWNTQVGEGGRALSGGERQRVAIARALLKNARIVLFDEATSSLDTDNEDNIVASMEALRQSSTLIVIAHKLTTIKNADQIVLFTADGRIEDIGTHEELIARGGTYREFWDYRQRARGWQLESKL